MNINLKMVGAFVLVAALAVAGWFLPVQKMFLSASPAGSTFNTAKIAQISVAPSAPGTNATSSSILNTDANDRYILSEEAGCENVGTSKTAYTGAGLAALTATLATSSTAAPPTAGGISTNTVGGGALTIGTSTAFFVISSSTSQVAGNNNISNIWAAGSYLTVQFNATNTAACVIGVRYIAS